MPVWISNFSQARRSSRIFYATSAMAIIQKFSIVRHALSLRLFARFSDWRIGDAGGFEFVFNARFQVRCASGFQSDV